MPGLDEKEIEREEKQAQEEKQFDVKTLFAKSNELFNNFVRDLKEAKLNEEKRRADPESEIKKFEIEPYLKSDGFYHHFDSVAEKVKKDIRPDETKTLELIEENIRVWIDTADELRKLGDFATAERIFNQIHELITKKDYELKHPKSVTREERLMKLIPEDMHPTWQKLRELFANPRQSLLTQLRSALFFNIKSLPAPYLIFITQQILQPEVIRKQREIAIRSLEERDNPTEGINKLEDNRANANYLFSCIATPIRESEVKSVTPQSKIKSVTPQSEIKSVTPQSEIKSVTPQSEIKSVTPQSEIKSVTPPSPAKSNITKGKIARWTIGAVLLGAALATIPFWGPAAIAGLVGVGVVAATAVVISTVAQAVLVTASLFYGLSALTTFKKRSVTHQPANQPNKGLSSVPPPAIATQPAAAGATTENSSPQPNPQSLSNITIGEGLRNNLLGSNLETHSPSSTATSSNPPPSPAIAPTSPALNSPKAVGRSDSSTSSVDNGTQENKIEPISSSPAIAPTSPTSNSPRTADCPDSSTSSVDNGTQENKIEPISSSPAIAPTSPTSNSPRTADCPDSSTPSVDEGAPENVNRPK